MAVSIYPYPTLPSPQVIYSGQQEAGVVGLEMDGGNRRSRSRYTDLKETITLEFKYNREQLTFFRGWHKHTLLNGADKFTMEFALNSEPQIFLLQIEGGKFSYERISDTHWSVSMKVHIDDTRTITEAELDAILST